MFKFRRILVCLDQSDMDETLINAAAEYASFGNADNIYFINVVKSLEMPTQVKKKYGNLVGPLDEKVEQLMEDSIKNAFDKMNCQFHFDVREGDSVQQILKWAKIKEIDLIILGKKLKNDGRGHISRNVVNLSPCSALFVTPNSKIEPKSILLPTDFSSASEHAYQKAIMIAKHVNASVTCLHTFEVPSGYHTIGKTYEEFTEIMLGHSKEDCKEFLKTGNENFTNLKVEYLLDKHGHPDKIISEYASAHNFDLIIIGSKGRTALSAVLLGSVAAKVVEMEINMPILIVKEEEENLGLVDAILKL